MNPLLRIVIPCYNQGQFLREALSFTAFLPANVAEYVIVNDGSTDPETLEILAELANEGHTILNQTNEGLAKARNAGAAGAQTPYLLFLDADNQLLPAYWEAALPIFEQNPNIGVVYSRYQRFGEVNEEDTPEIPAFDGERLLTGNFIDACAFIRREAFEQSTQFDAQMPAMGYEDWELWIQLHALGWQFQHTHAIGFRYRVRAHSMISGMYNPDIRRKTIHYIVAKHHALYQLHFQHIIPELHAIVAHWEVTAPRLQREFAEKEVEFSTREAAIKQQHELALQTLIQQYEAQKTQLKQLHAQELEAAAWAHQEAQIQLTQAHEHALNKLQATFETEKNSLLAQLAQKELELEKARQEHIQLQVNLELQRAMAENLQHLIQTLQHQVHSMEATRTWRLRKQYYKFRSIFQISGKKKRRIPGLGFLKKIFFFLFGKGRIFIRRFFKKVFKHLYLWLEEIPVRIIPEKELASFQAGRSVYEQWMLKNMPGEADFKSFKRTIREWSYTPTVSILLPVYNPPIALLKQTIESVMAQLYEHWELCIVDDCSPNPEVRNVLAQYQKNDFRIKIKHRKSNGHISRTTNDALEMATGDYCLLLDHDDLLTQDCLFHCVQALQRSNRPDLVYSDEDKIDENGIHSVPHFKPDWSPDNFLSRNYLGHVIMVNTQILRDIGGFRTGFEGSQDYDMLLRFTEQTDRIYHIPKVLYHWRIHAASAAAGESAKPYAYAAAQKALTEACERRGWPAHVDYLPGFRGYTVRFKLQQAGKVSIIIPTKNNADVLKTCIDSIFERSTWRNFEIIVLSNNSDEKALFSLLDTYQHNHNQQFKWAAHNTPFNFSELMNVGVGMATGEFIVLLNNDTEIISADWLEALMEQAQRPTVGAVGCKLLYHNDTIQHAGVIVGLGGVAGHAFTGQYKSEAGYFNFIQSMNNYSAVTAACLMVQTDKYKAIQGFDEQFAVEYNDVDFCLRLREQGWHNVYVPHVELYHYESLTRGHPHMSKESYERHIREVELFKKRWINYIDNDPCYSPHLSLGVHDFGIAL